MKAQLLGISFSLLATQLCAGPKGFGPSEATPRLSNSLTIEEILRGDLEPTTDSIDSIFSLFDNTHTWKPKPETEIKLWQGLGKWPGHYPLALQVFNRGQLVAAEKLDFPAASKLLDVVAFSHSNMFVLNLTCRHRHEDYESKCAFSVGFGSRIINGGPVISDDILARKKAASAVYVAEPTAAGQPATSRESK